MMTLDEASILASLLQAGVSLDVVNKVGALINQRALCQEAWEKLTVQFNLTSQDRDARRTRMELAAYILDYGNDAPIQDLWGAIIGTRAIMDPNEVTQLRAAQAALNEQVFQMNQAFPRTFGAPVPTDPTPQPTNNHRHKVQASGDGRILSSFCECGQFVADIQTVDVTQQPTTISRPAYNTVDGTPTLPKCDGNHAGKRCDDPECWLACRGRVQEGEIIRQCILTDGHPTSHTSTDGFKW